MIKETGTTDCSFFFSTTSQVILSTFLTNGSAALISHARRRVTSSAYSRVHAQHALGSLCQQLLVDQEPRCRSAASCPTWSSQKKKKKKHGVRLQMHSQASPSVALADDISSGWCCQSRASQAFKAILSPPLYCQQSLRLHLNLKTSESKLLPKFHSRIQNQKLCLKNTES